MILNRFEATLTEMYVTVLSRPIMGNKASATAMIADTRTQIEARGTQLELANGEDDERGGDHQLQQNASCACLLAAYSAVRLLAQKPSEMDTASDSVKSITTK